MQLCGEYVGEPGLEPCVCLTSQPVLLTTVLCCSFAIWIDLGSPEPLITTLYLQHAAFCCLPPACSKHIGYTTCEVDVFIQLAIIPPVPMWAGFWYGIYRDDQHVVKDMLIF